MWRGSKSRFGSVVATALLIVSIGGASSALAKKEAPPEPEKSTFDQTIDGLERHEGLLTTYLDRKAGKVWLEVPAASGPSGLVGEFLYVEGLASGLGSNPVGLDRGQLGDARLVRLRRLGGRLLIEEPNLRYRALSEDPREVQAVRESFATSVLWAGALDKQHADGRAVVDLTSFLVRDAHGVGGRLKEAGQGTFRLDADRSAIDLDACLAFPDNLEFEVLLTYEGEEPGRDVRDTTPTPEAVSLIQHYSLIRLPDEAYSPRKFDPRAGSFAIYFRDYAVPLDGEIEQRWIVRHRLEKVNPGSAPSPVKEPIVYYVDRGAPEAVRNALLDGARWWAEAFEAAGFIDAYRVEVMPEDIHPLDVRYNVIQWVHRSTRGWSYGGGIIDPRTGEMIKGHVNLGSLRVRQDRLMFEGLAGAGETGSGSADDPVELALARIRQLSAHEVGHTLGLTHNFAASTYGRASVMDYPAPWVRPTNDGGLDFSESYAVGAGAWDLHAIRFAYSEFGEGADEAAELDGIVQEGLAAGYLFVADADARPAGAAQPMGNLWDNGDDPLEELGNVLEVRRRALANFGPANLRAGQPMALLNEVLVPIYLYHRFQLQAALKNIGGVHYQYAVAGDGQAAPAPVSPLRQLRALELALEVLEPESLDLSDEVLAELHPRPFGYWGNRELFPSGTAPMFDPIGVAAIAANQVVRGILQSERAARLVDQHRRDDSYPGLQSVLGAVVDAVFENPAEESERRRAIRRATQQVVVDGLIDLAAGSAPASVRAGAERQLANLRERLRSNEGEIPADRAQIAHLRGRIRRFLERAETSSGDQTASGEMPPGQPIGQGPEWLPFACGWSENGG